MRKPIKKGNAYIDNKTGQLHYADKDDSPKVQQANKNEKYDKVIVALIDQKTNEQLGIVDPTSFKESKVKEWDALTWEQLDIGFMGTVTKPTKKQEIKITTPATV